MGADMMAALAKVPAFTPAAKAWCAKRAVTTEQYVQLEQQAMLARVAQLEIPADGGAGEYLVEYDEARPAAALRKLLERAVVALAKGRRDVTTVRIGKDEWMITGGMSWGDVPTDAYDLVNAVDIFGITDRAITLGETKSAYTAAGL